MSLTILIITCFTLLIINLYQLKKIRLLQNIYIDTLYDFSEVYAEMETLHEKRVKNLFCIIDLKDLRIKNLKKINQSTNAIKNKKIKALERENLFLSYWKANLYN